MWNLNFFKKSNNFAKRGSRQIQDGYNFFSVPLIEKQSLVLSPGV